MSIIIALIVSVCNIFYSIWYLENAEYKDREKKLKIRKNGRIIIYTGTLMLTCIVYYYFGLKYSIGISFVISIILQNKLRNHISDLTSGLFIVTGVIYSITESIFIPIIISTAVVAFPYLIIYLYGPALAMVIKTLIEKDNGEESEQKIEVGKLDDIKVLIGIMIFMATKVNMYGVGIIILTVLGVTALFILPKIVYLIICKRKTVMNFTLAPYILIGIVVYVEVIKKW